MKKILVSACLLGEPVRYDGKDNFTDNNLLQHWVMQQRVISFCPEVAGGMTIPRKAAEINGGDGHTVLAGSATVIDNCGTDVTNKFLSGAQLTLAVCEKHQIAIAILTQRSPSCGNNTIYDGTFSGKTISGSGVTAALLTQHGIRVFNQFELEIAANYLNNLT